MSDCATCRILTTERDDYRRLAEEYSSVIMELKAEIAVQKDEIARGKELTIARGQRLDRGVSNH